MFGYRAPASSYRPGRRDDSNLIAGFTLAPGITEAGAEIVSTAPVVPTILACAATAEKTAANKNRLKLTFIEMQSLLALNA